MTADPSRRRTRPKVAGRARQARPDPDAGPGPTTKRAIRWTRGKVLSAVVVVLASVGAVLTGVIVQSVEQVVDPNQLLDATRGEPAVRVTVDSSYRARVALPYQLNPTGADVAAVETERDGYFVRNGGVAVGEVNVTLGLEGRRKQTVRVTGIRPVVLKREAPYGGTLGAIFDLGGFDVEQMRLDLDSATPIAREVDAASFETGGPFFEGRSITLAEGEILTTLLQINSSSSYIEFEILIDVVYGSERDVVRVDNNGKPFAVTGCAGELQDYGVVYIFSGMGTQRINPESWVPPDDLVDFVQSPC